MKYKFFYLNIIFMICTLISCSSYEKFQRLTNEYEAPSIVLKSDFNQAWQAVLTVMKKFDIAYQNLDSGTIKTRWIDNTQEINFADAFGNSDAVKAARFKLVVTVVKGFRSGQEVSQISVHRRQLVEQDFLQGWKEVPTDGIEEKTLLYRIERLVRVDNHLKEIEKEKEKEVLGEFN